MVNKQIRTKNLGLKMYLATRGKVKNDEQHLSEHSNKLASGEVQKNVEAGSAAPEFQKSEKGDKEVKTKKELANEAGSMATDREKENRSDG